MTTGSSSSTPSASSLNSGLSSNALPSASTPSNVVQQHHHHNQHNNNLNNNSSSTIRPPVTTTPTTTIIKLPNSSSSSSPIVISNSSTIQPTTRMSPVANVTMIKKLRNDLSNHEQSSSRTPDVNYSSSNAFGAISRTSASSASSSGELKFGYEPQGTTPVTVVPAALVINTNATALLHHHGVIKESPPSSPGSEASARKRRKGGLTTTTITPQPSPNPPHILNFMDKDVKDSKNILSNGIVGNTLSSTHHMLGNQLNPASSVAKNMTETLNMEIEAHSIYSHDAPPNLIGPVYPGRKETVRIDDFKVN